MYNINFKNGKDIAIIYKKVNFKNNEIERRVAILKITEDKPKQEDLISSNDNNLKVENNMFNKPSDDYILRLSPKTTENNNNRIVVIAPSGAGKSTWAKNYVKDYKKVNNNNDVFLFSSHKEDPSIDEIKPNRVNLDESEIIMSKKQMQPLLYPEDFKDSLVIFDDINTSRSKILQQYWFDLAQDLAENGRKYKIDLLFLLHNTSYSNSRILMSEASHFVFFLNSGAKSLYMRLFKSYLCIEDKKTINKLFKLKSRYIVFSTMAPKYIITTSQLILFNDFEESIMT